MPRRLTPRQEAAVAARYLAGESGPSLGQRYGVDHTVIYAALRRRGVARRSKGDAGGTGLFGHALLILDPRRAEIALLLPEDFCDVCGGALVVDDSGTRCGACFPDAREAAAAWGRCVRRGRRGP